MSKESYPNELDRLLTPAEQMLFANSVIWPAVDYLYGERDFRMMAQVSKNVRLRPKTTTILTEFGATRITLEANSPTQNKVIREDGETEVACLAQVTIGKMHPELKEGALEVMEQEPDPDDIEDNDDPDAEEVYWWQDEDFDWQIWEVKTFDFTNDSTNPFITFSDFEAHKDDEDEEFFLWNFNKEDTEPDISSMDKILAKRKAEFSRMLSYRDCLEIRDALVNLDVPYYLMASIE